MVFQLLLDDTSFHNSIDHIRACSYSSAFRFALLELEGNASYLEQLELDRSKKKRDKPNQERSTRRSNNPFTLERSSASTDQQEKPP